MSIQHHSTPSLWIPSAMKDQLIALAEAAFPREAVALIGYDTDGAPASVVPLNNRAAEPDKTYFVPPAEHYEAEKVIVERSHYVGAIFHSHPQTKAEPSDFDLATVHEGKHTWIAGREWPRPGNVEPFGLAGCPYVLRTWDGDRELIYELRDS